MVKRRTPGQGPTPEEIEAFGAAAVSESAGAANVATRPTVPPAGSRSATAGTWPVGVPKALQLRFKDPRDPALLQALTVALDRSQHEAALRIFRRGLEVMAAEHGISE